MDSKEPADPAAPSETPSQPTDISAEQIQRQTDDLPASTPLEMSSLPSQPSSVDPPGQPEALLAPATPPQISLSDELKPEQSSAMAVPQSQNQPTEDDSMAAPESTSSIVRPTATRARQESSAIGPDTDAPTILADSSAGPAVIVTLLLISGARHPYKIDEPYLRRRNVASADEEIDPFTISVYTMKELIWRDWRHEWESRPSSPSYIRLIHFGKLLDDKSTLREYFKPDTPNVVHMSVKPQDLGEDDDNTKLGSQQAQPHDDDANVGCCRCVIL